MPKHKMGEENLLLLLMKRVWTKKGHLRSPASSGEACVVAVHTQRPGVTTRDGLVTNIPA